MEGDIGHAKCPVCGAAGCMSQPDAGDARRLVCATCGEHVFSALALTLAEIEPAKRPQLAHGIRKLPAGAVVDDALLVRIRDTTQLPSALERIDNLVLHLARQHEPGEKVTLSPIPLMAVIGAANESGARWVFQQSVERGLVQAMGRPSSEFGVLTKACLSARGWERYAELVREGARSRHAFMAMKFGDAELDRVYREHMRPAVAATGFELRATNEDHQTAGSIDDRMRVEIRTSRFVICDLTHGNRGAYWEAGFAEGVGRPVFFTCREDVLADSAHPDHPHFDAAHQLIIAWTPAQPTTGMGKLKNAIRATLPTEASLED